MTGHFFLLIFIAEKLDLLPIDIEDGFGLKEDIFIFHKSCCRKN